MEWILVVAGAGVVTAFVGGALFWDRIHAEERRTIWKQVASRRGAYVEPVSSLLRRSSEAIEASVEHAIVRVDLHVVSAGKTTTTYTRARAGFALGAGPRFEVYEETPLSTLGKKLGTQDLELGDTPFDEVFMVKGEGVEEVRGAWTHRARRLLIQKLPQTRAESDGRVVTLTLLGATTSAGVLDAMLDLAGELASAGARELAPIAALPDATLEPTSGAFDAPTPPRVRIATERGDAIASLTPARCGASLSLTLPSERDIPSFRAEVSEGAAEGIPKGVLTERATGMLGAIDGAALSADDRALRIVWPGVPEPTDVAAGAELLAELTGGSRSVGAFR